MLKKQKKDSKLNTVQQTYILNEETLDQIVASVQKYAESARLDKRTATRCSFLIDNGLYYWLEHGGKGKEIKVSFTKHFFIPRVTIEMEGEQINPYPVREEDYGSGSNDINVYASHLPSYEYRNEVNTIVLDLKRESSIIRRVCIAALAAALLGTLGMLFLEEGVRELALSNVVDPIVDMFFNLLRCIAGPMVFFSVIWSICGIGDSRIFGRIGKSVMLYSIGITALGAAVGAFAFPFLGNGFVAGSINGKDLSSLLGMVLNIVPSSIVEPFSTGNTLQIIFLSVAMGTALIVKSNKTNQLVSAISQFNFVVQTLMNVVGALVPYIVFMLLVQMIWTSSLSLITSLWKLLVAVVAAFVVITLILCAITAIRQKVNFLSIAKKNLTTFLISFTTASSSASFGSNIDAASKQFGIADEMAGFSISLGIIVHNPIAACYDILLVLYFGAVYDISCSFGWLIMAILVSTIVAISTPPIPGGGLVGYTLLFAQLGVPAEALVVVMLIDALTDFIVTAFECYVLPISLVNVADSMGQLNKEVLRDEKRKERA